MTTNGKRTITMLGMPGQTPGQGMWESRELRNVQVVPGKAEQADERAKGERETGVHAERLLC